MKGVFSMGISRRVSLGLLIIILVASISTGIAVVYFGKSSLLFRNISGEQLPQLIVAAKLAKEVEGIVSRGSELALSSNILVLQSLVTGIKEDQAKIEVLISDLQTSYMTEAAVLTMRTRQISENFLEIEKLTEDSLKAEQRILQLSLVLRKTADSIKAVEVPQGNASLTRLQNLLLQSLSFQRDIPNVHDRQRLEEYQAQLAELMNEVDEIVAAQPVETNIFLKFYTLLDHYGRGETSLLSLMRKQLLRKEAIQDRLQKNSFFSEELVKQTEQIFAAISTEVKEQSHTFADEIQFMGNLLLTIPLVIIFSAILIYLFIQRSVIGRILTLEKRMKAHVQGQPLLPLPVEGNDEITSMAQSVSYFLENRKVYEKSLEDARLVSETASQAKSAFLANMSHELRTPLNAVLGFCQLLARSPALSPQEAGYLEIIRNSGEHLLTLINQILDLATIESGRLRLNIIDFDLYALLSEMEEMFHHKARSNNLTLHFNTAKEVPRFIRTDPVKLRQVFINLLNNGLKFTEKGGITVDVEVAGEHEQILSGKGRRLALAISVKDTGIGLSPAEIERIFEPFEQTSAGRMAKEGTGLGLTICRSFVQLMGGEMSVTSRPGKGSRFDFHILVEESTGLADPASPRQILTLQPGQPLYRILVADDNPLNRLLLIRFLEMYGFDLKEAVNGQNAFDVWETWHPHLIFMDMRMPILNGPEAAGKIKATAGGAAVKIVAISAGSPDNAQPPVPADGFDDCLVKPIRDSDIQETLEKHLGLRWRWVNRKREQHPPSTAEKDTHHWQSRLQSLSPASLKLLKNALIRADLYNVEAEIDQIGQSDGALAEKLRALAEDFQYESILSLMPESEEDQNRDDTKH